MFFGLRRQETLQISKGWGRYLIQIVFAAMVMTGSLYLVLPPMETWFADGFFVRLGRMLLICLIGALTYAAALFVSGVRPAQFVR